MVARMHRALLAALMLFIVPLSAGCIGDGDDEDEGDTTPPALAWMPQWSNTTFTGTVAAANPLTDDPQTSCSAVHPGQEGVTYAVHDLTVPNATTNVSLTLTWDLVATDPVSAPDLEMYLWNAAGEEITGCAGESSGHPERIQAVLSSAEQYQVGVSNYAGAATDYVIDVRMSYAEERVSPTNETAAP